MVRAVLGIRRSTVRSTAELFTCVTTPLNGDATRTEPMTQAMSSTDSTLTAAPPTLSRNAAGRQLTCERSAVPMAEAANWPMMASSTRMITATRSCWFWPPTKSAGDTRGEQGPRDRTTEEPGEAQRPDDEPLPVTRHRERGRNHQQRQVQQISVHEP